MCAPVHREGMLCGQWFTSIRFAIAPHSASIYRSYAAEWLLNGAPQKDQNFRIILYAQKIFEFSNTCVVSNGARCPTVCRAWTVCVHASGIQCVWSHTILTRRIRRLSNSFKSKGIPLCQTLTGSGKEGFEQIETFIFEIPKSLKKFETLKIRLH